MSAQIPETMLLSDLLKPTGYDCPEEFQGKTFEEATTGGSDIQTNKAATIDVSAYTEPVEIKPDTDYTATKKVTVTLSNIPSGADLESNHAATIDVSTYTEPVEIEPTAGKDGMEKVTVTLSNIPSGGSSTAYAWKHSGTTVQYFNFDVAPADLAGMSASKSLESGGGGVITVFPEEGEIDAYTRTSDTEFTVTFGSTELTFVRDATNDFTLWS